MWNERKKIPAMELKMRNLSLWIKCSFSKINYAFFCPALFYSTFKSVLKNFERMLLVHHFYGFFRFLNWVFKAFLLNRFKNLTAHFRLYRKWVGVRAPWTPTIDARMERPFEWYIHNVTIFRKKYFLPASDDV